MEPFGFGPNLESSLPSPLKVSPKRLKWPNTVWYSWHLARDTSDVGSLGQINMRIIFSCLVFAACGHDEPKTEASKSTVAEPSPPDEPSAWEYEGEAHTAEFDQAKIEESIAAAIAQVRIITGHSPINAYLNIMGAADEHCPTNSEYEGSSYWYGGCTTSSGTQFEGYSFYEEYVDSPLFGEGSNMFGTSLNTQGSVVLGDGNRFDMGGSVQVYEGTINNEEIYAWFTAVDGTFGWADSEMDESWMGGPIRPTIQSIAYLWTFEDGSTHRAVNTTAGLAGLEAEWDTVYLSEVFSVDSLGGYWPCTDEPSGRISVRSTEGDWFQVVYDVEQDGDAWAIAPGACDGCGTVFIGGEAVGEVCNDFSVLRDWEDQPW
jgi:hypothetical protein